MTALVWDQVGERLYETGVDRGVLYLPGGSAVPWNGLISINEMVSREVKPYYIDGIKFLDHHDRRGCGYGRAYGGSETSVQGYG